MPKEWIQRLAKADEDLTRQLELQLHRSFVIQAGVSDLWENLVREMKADCEEYQKQFRGRRDRAIETQFPSPRDVVVLNALPGHNATVTVRRKEDPVVEVVVALVGQVLKTTITTYGDPEARAKATVCRLSIECDSNDRLYLAHDHQKMTLADASEFLLFPVLSAGLTALAQE